MPIRAGAARRRPFFRLGILAFAYESRYMLTTFVTNNAWRSNMATPKARTSPRISVNKLGEYVVANALRRRAIIKDQKKPRTIYVARYGKAEAAIQDYIVAESPRPEELAIIAREMLTAEHATSWQEETAELCAKALHSFIKIADAIPVRGLARIKVSDNIPKMNIADVAVSVRPEILLARPESPAEIIGAVKLYFSKSTPLHKGPAEFIASIVYRYIAECVSTEALADYKLCFVLDVFSGNIFVAPKSFKNHMKNAQTNCMEIAALWPTISV